MTITFTESQIRACARAIDEAKKARDARRVFVVKTRGAGSVSAVAQANGTVEVQVQFERRGE